MGRLDATQEALREVVRARGLALARGLVVVVSVVAGLAGCLGTSPPPRLTTPTPVAVVVMLEGADGAAAEVPAAAWEAIEGALRARNLEPVRVAAEALGEGRTSDARLAALRQAHAAPWVVLVEARARFFSQLSGRYRWEVEVRSSVVAPAGDSRSDLSVAAFLPFEREREPEALTFVRRQVAEDVGAVVDRLVAR